MIWGSIDSGGGREDEVVELVLGEKLKHLYCRMEVDLPILIWPPLIHGRGVVSWV